MRHETERQIHKMLKNDVIEESTSPYQSPVVMVKKSNGQYRFAVDYRKLNIITGLVSFPIPKLDEVFDTIADSKSKIFSVLDLASGFWQVPLDEKTQAQNCINHTSRALPVQTTSFWLNKCSNKLPDADDESFTGTKLENCSYLH